MFVSRTFEDFPSVCLMRRDKRNIVDKQLGDAASFRVCLMMRTSSLGVSSMYIIPHLRHSCHQVFLYTLTFFHVYVFIAPYPHNEMFLSFELDAYVLTLRLLDVHCTSPQAFQTYSFLEYKYKLIWSTQCLFGALLQEKLLGMALRRSKCMGHKFRTL